MSDTDDLRATDLRATVEVLIDRVRRLEDQVEIMQLVAQYGPAVDSGSAEATAALWTDDGIFDAVPHLEMRGRDDIVAMVSGVGHQSLIHDGCGHVLTVPHIVVDGDHATGRSYALNIRWDAEADRFWVARVSANTWRWERTPQGWRVAERINANLDGTPEHREMLAPATGDDAAAEPRPER
jgi:ketosteroid isomerase-like protein